MKVQNQQLEYTGLFLCSFANLSSRLFMLQDGDQILTQGTSQHFTIWGHPWPHCSSTAKERMGVVADGTSDETGIGNVSYAHGAPMHILNLNYPMLIQQCIIFVQMNPPTSRMILQDRGEGGGKVHL
jgi:hypothetical protein